jgi:hypothetical protein
MVFEVPLLLLEHLGVIERADVERRGEALVEPAADGARTGDTAALEQAGADGDVAFHFRLAVGDRPHRVRDFEADVPQQRQEALDRRCRELVRRLRQQQQNVDVRMGKQLATAVAADGDQRHVGRHV